MPSVPGAASGNAPELAGTLGLVLSKMAHRCASYLRMMRCRRELVSRWKILARRKRMILLRSIALIEPITGVLASSRELLERRRLSIFRSMLHDGIVVGCAALYPHLKMRLACIVFNGQCRHREWGHGRTADATD